MSPAPRAPSRARPPRSRPPAPGSAPANGPPRAPRRPLAGEPDQGLFGPGSMTWRVNRENVLLLGGGRALILQVAHPLVGAGVAQHSNYQADPWSRLFRTLDLTTAVVFGTTDEAEQAAERVWRRHGPVNGVTTDGAGRFPPGTPYDARDPALAMWVAATLIDTSLLTYDRYVARLSLAEREAYYEEQKTFAHMFGVPFEHIPETYADFNAYFDEVVEHDLADSQALRGVVAATLDRPALPWLAAPARPVLAWALRLATLGELPVRLREQVGLAWGPTHERLRSASSPLISSALRLAPSVVRDFPRARAAERRAVPVA